jgi:hypothetical protein
VTGLSVLKSAGVAFVGEEYGDAKSIEKDVRLVTTITFYLTD